MFSSPSRSKRKNNIFVCFSPFSVSNIISAYRSASSSSSTSQRITKADSNRQQQQHQHLTKIKDVAFSPFSTSSAFLEQVKKLPNNSIEKLSTLEKQSNINNNNNLSNLLSSNTAEQRQSSILLLPPPPSPWCYVCRDENAFQNQETDENEKLFISLKFSETCSVRAFVSKDGAVATKNQNKLEIDPELTRHRISGPLQNLFQNFPDLVLEGNFVVPFEIVDEFSSLSITSLLAAKNGHHTNKNKSMGVIKKLLSSSNDFGLQFFVYDIAYWNKFGNNNNNNNNLPGVSFEVRMSMLQKMLKATVDPYFLGFLNNTDAMQDLIQQFENFTTTGPKRKQNCDESGNDEDNNGAASKKSIVFLGNVTLEGQHESIQERNKKVEELLNVVVGNHLDEDDERQLPSPSLFLDGITLHHSSTSSSSSGFFTHVHREESDFEIVKFISSDDEVLLDGVEQQDRKVAGFECVTSSGEKFVAPLTGVSDEIRKQLWAKRHVLFSSLRKKSSSLFATVEYSEIQKNSTPKEPLAKKIKGR